MSNTPPPEEPSKLSDMKEQVQQEIQMIEEDLNEMNKMRNKSIAKIEEKKEELRRLSEITAAREQHAAIIEELRTTRHEIEERRLSIAHMDQTITDLDHQIAAIQAEHDRICSELELKKNRLYDKVKFYEELNLQIEKLVDLLKNEEMLFKLKFDDLQKQKEGLMANTDLSPDTLEQALKDLDAAIEKLKQEHEAVKNQLKVKLSVDLDPSFRAELIAEIERKMAEGLMIEPIELRASYEPLYGTAAPWPGEPTAYLEMPGEGGDYPMRLIERSGIESKEKRELTEMERLVLTRRGLLITPSNRIITKDDKEISYEDARRMGLLEFSEMSIIGEDDDFCKCHIIDEIKPITLDERLASLAQEPIVGESVSETLVYDSIVSQMSTLFTESSTESLLSNADINYLKNVFGKALSLGLAEITAVQPTDPIHYLAHWLFKYRFNQEIQQIREHELQQLMAERKRLEDQRTHEAIEAEAKQAVLDAWLAAEKILIEKDLLSRFESEEEEDMLGPEILF